MIVRTIDLTSNEGNSVEIDGRWIPYRGLNYQNESLWRRFKQAWGVLLGRFDVLDWGPGDTCRNDKFSY